MKTFYLTYLFFALFIFQGFSQISSKSLPTWVNSVEYDINPNIDSGEISEGKLTLLYDEQINISTQEDYVRTISKIVDNVGIQSGSNITTSYDPSYQSLSYHHIHIIRDGKVIDKLNLDHFELVRREPNAENYIYDGSKSAILNLSDVRTGDIIDYSYTVKGFNPIHNGLFSDFYYLNDYDPIGTVSVQITSPTKLNYKTKNTSLEPTVSSLGNSFHYSWKQHPTDKMDFESNTPSWKLLYENLFISQYNSWNEVVNWGIELFKVNEPLDKELLEKIEDIRSNNKTEGEKIKAALDFVQNEVRYLGIENGIGSYKPFAPNKIFGQRYGDCKDKSLLLVTMLKSMGIEAYPMLVNTTLKHVVKDLLPTPKLFDHCVVKVIDGVGNNIWYDPTIDNQGGLFNTTYFPNYECGLVLKPNNGEFDEIYSFASNLVEVLDDYVLEDVGKGGTLNVTTTYYENQADGMRSYFKNGSISTIKKEFETYYKNYHKTVTALKNPEIEDHIKENKFIIRESYQLDSIWNPLLGDDKKIMVSFEPTSIADILLLPEDAKRTSEFALYYPITKRHNIQVQLPSKWDINEHDYTINSKGFYYEFAVKYNKRKNILNINHYYKSQSSYIPVEEFDQYYKDINKLQNNIAYMIYIPKSAVSNGAFQKDSDSDSGSNPMVFIVILAWLAIIGGIIFYIRSRK